MLFAWRERVAVGARPVESDATPFLIRELRVRPDQIPALTMPLRSTDPTQAPSAGQAATGEGVADQGVADQGVAGQGVAAVAGAVSGQATPVPVEVRSAQMVAGTFTAPATAAQELIAYSGLRVQRFAGTLALCMLSAVSYADTDLGPYNEIAVAVVVEPHHGADPHPRRRGGMTTFIHRLPVDQELSCAAGRDIWGFPKWVADITWQQRRGGVEVVMIDADEPVLSMRVDGRAVPVPPSETEMSCYSWREGVLRRTTWTMRLSGTKVRPGGVHMDLSDEHPMATELRGLRFPKGALLSQQVGHLECSFGPAEIVTPVGQPAAPPNPSSSS